MKPRDHVIAELEPLECPMRELGFTLQRSGKIRFVHQTGPRSGLGSRFFWITFHVSVRPDVSFFVSWAVYARLREDASVMSMIFAASSREVPGWKSYMYPENTIASQDFRVGSPVYAADVRPLLADNLSLGARFLLAHGDLRRAAEFAVSQSKQGSLMTAFDLYLHLGDVAAARDVIALAADRADAFSARDAAQWDARRKLLTPRSVP